jgi:AraC family transcriptional regulator of adaptative response / DNA-3-methyladenine glycosylase II
MSGMELDHDICHRALRARDPRFDGRFFTGVATTGVYCRPVCPARTPRSAHCTFFACAAAAEEAGFRPCRRCRPETAPGTPAWRGTSATVARALRLIDEGALDDAGVEALAGRLGIGDRHLRRLFAEQLGASPLRVAHTRRVHFAKRLLEETDLSMTRIALAAGFRNVRRFNAAVRATFDRTPTAIRTRVRAGRRTAGDGLVTLRLAYRPPLDWEGMLAYLAPRATPGVEEVAAGVYRRTVSLDGFTGRIEVAPAPGGAAALHLRAPVDAAPVLARLADRTRAMFDLAADPAAVADALAGDVRLGRLVRRRPGLRVPGAWDRFELAVRAVLGQQITVAGATRLAGRLVRTFGRPLAGSDWCTRVQSPAVQSRHGSARPAPRGDAAAGPAHPDPASPAWLFPRPADLVDADLAHIGIPAARAETIRSLAGAALAGEPLLELAPDLETAVARLAAVPGIGDWTAQYVAMRALREPDAFPAGDLGLRKALARAGGGPLATSAVRRRSAAWRPWRAYAAMLLWQEPAATTRKETR